MVDPIIKVIVFVQLHKCEDGVAKRFEYIKTKMTENTMYKDKHRGGHNPPMTVNVRSLS